MKKMHKEMPIVAAFIDEMREAFGAENINASIRAALKDGKSTFYAEENGIVLGHKDTRVGLPLSKMVIAKPAAIVQATGAISATPKAPVRSKGKP